MNDPPLSREAPARAPLPDAWWRLSLRTRQLIAAGIAVGVVALVIGLVRLVSGGGDGDVGDGEPAPVVFVASLSPARVATWDDLAECESEGQWTLDTGNGYVGGLQFSLVSWQEVGGVGSPAAASREEQIMRGEFLFDLQGWGAWPSCSAQLGLE